MVMQRKRGMGEIERHRKGKIGRREGRVNEGAEK